MTTNIGNLDRVARAIVGVALIAATLSGLIGVWGWIGAVLLVTSLVSFCPLYAVLGMTSREAPATSKTGS